MGRRGDSLCFDPEPLNKPLEVFLVSLYAAHEIDESTLIEMGPVVNRMEREARIGADVSHLVFGQDADPPVEVIVRALELAAILFHLPQNEFSDPRCRVITKWLVFHIALDLEKSGIRPVIGVPDEGSRPISSAGLGQAGELGTREVLMDNAIEDGIEIVKRVVCALLEGSESCLRSLARGLPWAQDYKLVAVRDDHQSMIHSCGTKEGRF